MDMRAVAGDVVLEGTYNFDEGSNADQACVFSLWNQRSITLPGQELCAPHAHIATMTSSLAVCISVCVCCCCICLDVALALILLLS